MIEGYSRTPNMQGYGQLLFAPDMAARRACQIGTVLSALYAFVHLQFHYSPTILLHAGFDVSQMLSLQVGNQAARIVFSSLAVYVIDGRGRRPVLFGVFFFASAGFAVLAGSFWSRWGDGAAMGMILVRLFFFFYTITRHPNPNPDGRSTSAGRSSRAGWRRSSSLLGCVPSARVGHPACSSSARR